MASQKKSAGLFGALGAATGLGNAVRFPSLCARYGWAFILAYAVTLALVCFPLLCAELDLGKRCKGGLVGAFKNASPRWGWIALVAAANSAIVALYYGVIIAKCAERCVEFVVFRPVSLSEGKSLTLAIPVFFVVWLVLKGGGKRLEKTGKVAVCASLGMLCALFFSLLLKGSFKVFLPFGWGALLRGGIWADALGQSLLALSLAAGVMPAFAQEMNEDFSTVRTAAGILIANFCGCILAAGCVCGSSAEQGTAAALSLYAAAVGRAFENALLRRLFGASFFGVLTLVAVQSACSLALPLTGLFGEKSKFARAVFCVCGAVCFPLFAAEGGEVFAAVDRMACTVTAVAVAFGESLIFNCPRNMPRLTRFPGGFTRFSLKIICPSACGGLALFSLCGARFGGFSHLAVFCAFASSFAALAFSLAFWFLPQIKRRSFKLRL